MIGTIWSFFIHANVRVRFGWLKWLIAMPGFHRWHHINDPFRDRNYAPLLPILYVVFETLHLPKFWPTSYGIDDAMAPNLASPASRLRAPHFPQTWAGNRALLRRALRAPMGYHGNAT